MDILDVITVLLRWLHIVAGLLFVGLLWWFNFVFTPFNLAVEPDTRKKVTIELIPRALYLFRWSALYTLILGVLLLLIVFYHGQLLLEEQHGWTTGSYVMIAVVLVLYRVYDLLAKSRLGQDIRIFGAVGILILAAVVYSMIEYGQFSYRGYVIHTGVILGVIMVGNVWERIWPGQKKILDDLKAGNPPDQALFGQIMQRSKHNTYLSVPLLWTMIDVHTVVPAANSWLYLIGAVVAGWLLVAWMYRKAGKLQGW